MTQPNYIGVVDDGQTIGGSYLYRVNYGTFAISVESSTQLTISEVVAIADAQLNQQQIITVDPPQSNQDLLIIERYAYENKYLQATKQLMQLAGQTVAEGEWPKLSDAEFETVSVQALTNNPATASLLLTTLTYTLGVIKYDYRGTWADITYHA